MHLPGAADWWTEPHLPKARSTSTLLHLDLVFLVLLTNTNSPLSAHRTQQNEYRTSSPAAAVEASCFQAASPGHNATGPEAPLPTSKAISRFYNTEKDKGETLVIHIIVKSLTEVEGRRSVGYA
jgi:hypothetical protein